MSQPKEAATILRGVLAAPPVVRGTSANNKVAFLQIQPEGRSETWFATLGIGRDENGKNVAGAIDSMSSGDRIALAGHWTKAQWSSSAGNMEAWNFEAQSVAKLQKAPERLPSLYDVFMSAYRKSKGVEVDDAPKSRIVDRRPPDYDPVPPRNPFANRNFGQPPADGQEQANRTRRSLPAPTARVAGRTVGSTTGMPDGRLKMTLHEGQRWKGNTTVVVDPVALRLPPEVVDEMRSMREGTSFSVIGSWRKTASDQYWMAAAHATSDTIKDAWKTSGQDEPRAPQVTPKEKRRERGGEASL